MFSSIQVTSRISNTDMHAPNCPRDGQTMLQISSPDSVQSVGARLKVSLLNQRTWFLFVRLIAAAVFLCYLLHTSRATNACFRRKNVDASSPPVSGHLSDEAELSQTHLQAHMRDPPEGLSWSRVIFNQIFTFACSAFPADVRGRDNRRGFTRSFVYIG